MLVHIAGPVSIICRAGHYQGHNRILGILLEVNRHVTAVGSLHFT